MYKQGHRWVLLIPFLILKCCVLGSGYKHQPMECLFKTVRLMEALCTPFNVHTPCYKDTKFDVDTSEIVQVLDDSVFKVALGCCKSQVCTHRMISRHICCNKKTCLSQCYGYHNQSRIHFGNIRQLPITNEAKLTMPVQIIDYFSDRQDYQSLQEIASFELKPGNDTQTDTDV